MEVENGLRLGIDCFAKANGTDRNLVEARNMCVGGIYDSRAGLGSVKMVIVELRRDGGYSIACGLKPSGGMPCCSCS